MNVINPQCITKCNFLSQPKSHTLFIHLPPPSTVEFPFISLNSNLKAQMMKTSLSSLHNTCPYQRMLFAQLIHCFNQTQHLHQVLNFSHTCDLPCTYCYHHGSLCLKLSISLSEENHINTMFILLTLITIRHQKALSNVFLYDTSMLLNVLSQGTYNKSNIVTNLQK